MTNALLSIFDKASFKDEQLFDALFSMMGVFWHKSRENMRGKLKIG